MRKVVGLASADTLAADVDNDADSRRGDKALDQAIEDRQELLGLLVRMQQLAVLGNFRVLDPTLEADSSDLAVMSEALELLTLLSLAELALVDWEKSLEIADSTGCC